MTSFSLHSHQFHSFLPELYTTAIQGGTSTCVAGGQKKHGWMVYVSSHFFLVRLVGGGWWLGWLVLGWLGWLVLGCLCKQVTWLVAYLYPTQKQQPFGNCFGFHWVKMAWILMSSAGRFWKNISKESTLPRDLTACRLPLKKKRVLNDENITPCWEW